jgi:hypothetical protein
MNNPRLEDHAVGVELQLIEVVEQQHRAEVQGRTDDASALEREVEALQDELATTAEVACATAGADREPEVLAPLASEAPEATT